MHKCSYLIIYIYYILHLCIYRKIESLEGSRLLTLADFHLGSDANALVMHNMLVPPPIHSTEFRPPPPPTPKKGGRIGTSTLAAYPTAPYGTRLAKTLGTRTCLLIGTVDGGVGVLLPVDEKTYRSLSLLQQIMAIGVKTTCSLNQREYRLIKSNNNIHILYKRNVLDGVLLWKYANLPFALQQDLASVIGTSEESTYIYVYCDRYLYCIILSIFDCKNSYLIIIIHMCIYRYHVRGYIREFSETGYADWILLIRIVYIYAV